LSSNSSYITQSTEDSLNFMQETVVTLFKTIPNKDKLVFFYIIHEFFQYTRYAMGLDYKFDGKFLENVIEPFGDHLQTFPVHSNKLEPKFFLFTLELSRWALTVFQNEEIPVEWRLLGLKDFIYLLGQVMETKYASYPSKFWIFGVEIFLEVSSVAVNNILNSSEDSIRINATWEEILNSMRRFLFFAEKKSHLSSSPDLHKRDEKIDITVMELVSKILIENSKKVPLLHTKMVQVLVEGSHLLHTTKAVQQRERLIEFCYFFLFDLQFLVVN
jgi:hypothetical protein